LKFEPALIIGAAIAGLNALLTLLGAGGLDDGFQFNPDGYLILTPVLGALGIKFSVWSQASVDGLVPRSTQEQALRDRKRR
jgi:hypothetical protein